MRDQEGREPRSVAPLRVVETALTIGIVVGGRPTLGINGVIGAAPIEAANSGLRVLGMHHEFRHLADEYFTGMAR